MATYVALVDFTEQGMRTIKESPRRAQAFVERAKAMGAQVKQVYWTSGVHDGVLVIEAPDDRTVSALLLTLAGTGNVKTTTLRAFDRTEMEGILEKLAGA